MAKTSLKIQEDFTTADDRKRLRKALDEHTEEQGLEVNPSISTTFNAKALDGRTLASAIVTRDQEGLAKVDLLVTHKAGRKKGVGRKLLKHIEAFARAQGDTAMHLTTSSWQAPGFYERMGYFEMGRLPKKPDKNGKEQWELFYGKEL